jgi:hypothetical protein
MAGDGCIAAWGRVIIEVEHAGACELQVAGVAFPPVERGRADERDGNIGAPAHHRFEPDIGWRLGRRCDDRSGCCGTAGKEGQEKRRAHHSILATPGEHC